MLSETLRNHFPIILIIALAFVLRFIWIDKVPNAVGGDELTYVVNARAMFLTGTDISGNWNPLTGFIFKYPEYTNPQAELPYFLLSPFVGIFGFSLFWARVPFVLLSIGSVYLIYLITKTLFNKNAAIFASFIMAINPWSIYIGRTSYESSVAIFFFLLAFYMFLILKGRKILFTIPILFLAFYSYVGTKVSFLPFVFVIVLFSYFFVNKKKYLREYFIVIASCFALVLFFALAVFTTSGPTRAGDLISFNSPTLANQVDEVRKASIINPLTSLLENKITIFLVLVFTKFFKSISFDYLFLTGDQFFSLFRHGFFYILDALFLVFGLVFSYALSKRAFFLLFILSLIGILPQILHANTVDNFSIHLTLMFAVLPIFIGAGVYGAATIFKNKLYFRIAISVLVILYTYSVLYFANIYFYQFPLKGYFDFQVRLMSKYSLLASKSGQKITVYSTAVPDTFKKYIFYSNNYNKDNYLQIRKIYRSQKFSFQGINFSSCNRTINPKDIKGILVYDVNCGDLPQNSGHLALSRLSDGGQTYLIFNDTICSKFSLKGYPSNLSISDFSIEEMSLSKFCQTFVTKP